jgi:hypothetical protein
MTDAQARRLKVGDIVVYGNDDDDCGTVIQVNPNTAVRVRWYTYPEIGWLHFRDMMGTVSRAKDGHTCPHNHKTTIDSI